MEDFVHNDEQTIEVKALKDRLDNLWEKHLQLLDRYDQAQKQLSKHTSSAFFSIAQANFKSPSRARYGQDYYDERMQATRLASIQSTENGQYTISVLKPQANVGQPEPTTIPAAKGESKKTTSTEPQQQQPTPPSTPPPANDSDETASASGSPDDAPEVAAEPKKPRDPLQWFGILVPPALRSCQRSFVSAIEDPVPEAVNAARGMREVETEIRKLRKEIRKAEKRSRVSE